MSYAFTMTTDPTRPPTHKSVRHVIQIVRSHPFFGDTLGAKTNYSTIVPAFTFCRVKLSASTGVTDLILKAELKVVTSAILSCLFDKKQNGFIV